MIQFFKIGSADRLLLLLGLFLLLHLPYLLFNDQLLVQELLRIRLGERLADGWRLYAQAMDDTAPLSAFLYAAMAKLGLADFRIFRLLAAVILWFQSLWLNQMALRFNLVQERNYLIAFFYLMLAHVAADTATLSPVLIGLCFFLPALGKLFRIFKEGASADDAMLAGLWMGLAAASHLPFLIFLLPFIASALLFSGMRLNHYLILLAAAFLPFLSFYVFHLYQGGLSEFVSCIKSGFRLQALLLLCGMPLVLLCGGLLFLLSLAGWMFASQHSRANFHRLGLLVFIFCAFAGLVCLFTGPVRSTENVLFLLPMAAFLMAQLVLLYKNRLVSELLGATLLLTIITGFYQQAGARSWFLCWNKELFVQEPPKGFSANFRGKRLLLLSNDFRYYRYNSSATRFFRFYLSGLRRNSTETYQGLIFWYQCLEEDPPELIYDPDGWLNGIALRIPEFRKCYRTGFYPGLYEAIPGHTFGKEIR